MSTRTLRIAHPAVCSTAFAYHRVSLPCEPWETPDAPKPRAVEQISPRQQRAAQAYRALTRDWQTPPELSAKCGLNLDRLRDATADLRRQGAAESRVDPAGINGRLQWRRT